MENKAYSSDAEWYCRDDEEERRFYDIFFMICRKYNISWASAGRKEKAFIEEVTRATYEHDYAVRNGLPADNIMAFAS